MMYNVAGMDALFAGPTMSFQGEVRNGVVVLEAGAMLSEGTIVRVEPVGAVPSAEPPSGVSLAERLKTVIGAAKGLPPDLAEQHDHYLHGQPKR